MKAINPRDFERSVVQILAGSRVIILHGDNIQVKADILRLIRLSLQIDHDDPFRLVHLSSDTLDADPARLGDELRAMSMFGGSRLVHVHALQRQLPEVLAVAGSAPDGDWRLVIDVEELDAQRAAAVKEHADAIGVACGLEAAGDFRTFVTNEFVRSGISVSDEVLEFLLPLLGDDRAAARGEVEKLTLLAGSSGVVTVEQAEKIVADSSSVIADEIAAAALSGDMTALCTALDRLQSTGTDVPSALGAASRLAINIYRGKVNQWKSRDGVGQQLSADDFRRLVTIIQNAVLQVRSDSANASVLAQRSLVTLGFATRPRKRVRSGS